MTLYVATLEIESDSMLTKQALQDWFDRRTLAGKIGITQAKVTRVVATYGLARLLEEDREDT